MLALCDVCQSKPLALQESDTGWFKQVVSKVDAVNSNNRIYPREIYLKAIDKLKEESFPYAGEHPHPDSYIGADGCVKFNGSVSNSAVKFRDAYIDGDGLVWGEYKTLDTEMGRQVKSLIDAGAAIGFSNRMTGTLEARNVDGKDVEMATELRLITWDVVMNPAEKQAFGVPVLIDSDNEANRKITDKLDDLGFSKKSNERAAIITKERVGSMAIIDSLLKEMDREQAKRRIVADSGLRKANAAILDDVFKQFEKNSKAEYSSFMKALSDEAAGSMISTTGEFAQTATVSLAILRQTFNDLNFLQLCLVEGFTGPTYKMPVEFQSGDLYNEDIFTVGELEGVPTESIQTFLLEFGCEWLKRGFVVTKEAEKQLLSGGSNYDVIAANAASIASRFARIIDSKIAAEMIARADEYGAIRQEDEEASEIAAVEKGVNAPLETNAACYVVLSKVPAPIVRPRLSQWLDTSGRLKKEFINDIIVVYNDYRLTRGLWNVSKGAVIDINGTIADYAVDFENGVIYFKDENITDKSKLKITYSYATNVSYFTIKPPEGMSESKYYDKLLAMVDIEQAYMGSAPRYSRPDFLLGSLKAMVPFKQAELFYNSALPNGTEMLGGDIYFGMRNGVVLGAHNTPWPVGDQRLLLGKRYATRVGIGSEFSLEGPFQHRDGNMYTSAKEWIATQQVAINTPLVIDGDNCQYHPPYRTIKYI